MDAVHDRLICDEEAAVAASPVGTVGAAVSVVVVVFDTVMVVDDVVVLFPAASRAVAVRVWVPFADPVVIQDVEYGGVVSSAPRLTPSSLNWTPATPMLSEAVAETVIVPDTVVPVAGEVIAIVGRVVSAVLVGVPPEPEVVVDTPAEVPLIAELLPVVPLLPPAEPPPQATSINARNAGRIGLVKNRAKYWR